MTLREERLPGWECTWGRQPRTVVPLPAGLVRDPARLDAERAEQARKARSTVPSGEDLERATMNRSRPLDPEQVRRMYAEGMTRRNIARTLGVAESRVRRALAGAS